MILPVLGIPTSYPRGEPRDADADHGERPFRGIDDSRNEPASRRDIQFDPDIGDGPTARDHDLSLFFSQVWNSCWACVGVLEIGSHLIYPGFGEDRDVGRDGAKIVDRNFPARGGRAFPLQVPGSDAHVGKDCYKTMG